jgi:hypothetical protein
MTDIENIFINRSIKIKSFARIHQARFMPQGEGGKSWGGLFFTTCSCLELAVKG